MTTTASRTLKPVKKKSHAGKAAIKLVRADAVDIHPSAIVHPKARIGPGVRIGPWCLVGENVTIGRGTILENNVVLQGEVTLGSENHLGPYVSAGLPPQHLAYRGEPTRVEIGNRNVFREYVTIHRGTVQGGGVTRIGNHNYLMVFVHVGHDCHLGNHIIIANSCNLGGHVIIEDHANVGGMCGFHQFVRIGAYAMIGGCTAIRSDVIPFSLVEGNPARPHGLNSIGLRRNGFTPDEMSVLKKAYRTLLRSQLPQKEALALLETEFAGHPRVNHLVTFVQASRRGIYR